MVHRDHGIGRFDGLITLNLAGAPHDCLRLIYQDGDKLFVPVEHLDVLSRYGSADGAVQLDKLGGLGWQARKAKVKKRIREIAGELIEIAARRAMRKALIVPAPGLYDEFAARFAYDETDDQERAIEAVLDDLASGHPMDRLICGDVGFGKTEVALRAAFVVAMAGKQVAILAPTTLLVRQHFQVMRERFAGLPLRIEQVSRFVPAKQVAEIEEEALAAGDVDIVVGTHALLGDKIQVPRSRPGRGRRGAALRRGAQGEAEAAARRGAHAGDDRDADPAHPADGARRPEGAQHHRHAAARPPRGARLCPPTDPVVLREAILREHYRGGQIFYVCPRIEDQGKLAEQLRELVPEVKIEVAHGRLPARQLEDVMTAFYDRKIDLLVTTNIIEIRAGRAHANT